MDFETFHLGDFALQSGAVLSDAQLAYKTYGKLNDARDNVVVLPTFYTGTHTRNEGFFGAGRGVDPARHFVVSINLFGNGLSSSPSNSPPSCGRERFPDVTFQDNIDAQYRLLTERLDVQRVALVTGWSMAGCQAFHWAARYPKFVDAIVPFCASARTSPHNFVFLEGVKAALTADQAFADGAYDAPPERGLRAQQGAHPRREVRAPRATAPPTRRSRRASVADGLQLLQQRLQIAACGAIGAGGGSTASTFFTPIASYMFLYI